MAFNSPVWFNVGIEEKPQCSACFINSVDDTMSSIMDLAKTEAMLFKFGSGAGSNLTTIRSSKEKMAGGGTASGPVSFMKGYDAFAGVVKSGGKTRRAAKMVILDAGHPDVLEFIDSKAHEEQKAWALIEAGYDPCFTGEAYGSVFFQNANHSVRVTDAFMQAVVDDSEWTTHAVVAPHEPMDTYRARDIFRRMADAAHLCGDPGIQYDTTINEWHTSANTDRIHASNPCSEYMFLNDTACNLASLNLMKFVGADGEFDVEAYRFAAKVTITAQEILVDNASYPTPRIEENSHKFRPLGLGYANLGALLMSRGLAYDSDEGRNYAAALTAIMHGEAYKQSATVARDHGGPFVKYEENREPFLRVIAKHRDAAYRIPTNGVPKDLLRHATAVFDEALELGEQFGYRNAQVTVLAPTGTIAFMMDCDTTGVEPDIALIKYKKLVGEGFLKIVNQTVPAALRKLGYGAEEVDEILAYLMEHETIEGAPHLKPQHLPVFDCAFKPANGERSIHYMGHVRMMGAIQPFISGAISKTVNMPEAATAEEIERVYMEGWKLGLKAIAIYRDNSKRSQPLSTGKKTGDAGADAVDSEEVEKLRKQLAKAQVEAGLPHRRRLPAERSAVTHKFDIAGHEGYITVGLYPDGQPGEIFLKMAKEGSTVSGLMDTFATTVSVALQYGVPLKDLVNKFAHVRFEPSGFTGNQEIPIAKSIVDYIFRWLGSRFLSPDDKVNLGLIDRTAVVADVPASSPGSATDPLGSVPAGLSADAPPAPSAVANGGSPVDPPTATDADAPKGTAVSARYSRGGHAGFGAAGGHRHQWVTRQWACGEWEWEGEQREWRVVAGDAELWQYQGQLPDPGRRPQLRRMRLDHGPQRQLLQVPQLREHQRLQLTPVAIRSFAVEGKRGLIRASGSQLPDLVVIAGPNGVGKSTLLNELWKEASTFAEPGTKVTYVGPHRPWRKSTLSTASLFQMPYSYQQLLAMPSLPGWDQMAPPGLQFLGGMARDPFSSDEAQSLVKFELAKTEIQRLKLLQAEFERQGSQIAAGTLPDIYTPLRELTRFLLPHLTFDRVDIGNDRDVKCWFTRVDADSKSQVDLDDLSSGEKAIVTLFYPFLESQFDQLLGGIGPSDAPAPLPTTIIDEPEIHLHPTLQTALVSYLRELARSGIAQFILSTHSPTILDALDQDELYMLAPLSVVADGNQFVRVSSTDERLEALRSLTGSTHLVTRCRPVLFHEGEPPNRKVVSDQRLMETLVDEARGWVLVPASSRSQVATAATRFRDAATDGLPGVPVFALVDADRATGDPDYVLSWPVAMIENLLLDAVAIWNVIGPHAASTGLASADSVSDELLRLATLRREDEIRLRVPAMSGPIKVELRLDASKEIQESIDDARSRANAAIDAIDPATIATEWASATEEVDHILDEKRHLERFRGKELLKAFHDAFGNRAGFSYPAFVYAVAASARSGDRLKALVAEPVRQIQGYVPSDLTGLLGELADAAPEGEDRVWVGALRDRCATAREWWTTAVGDRPDLVAFRADLTRAARLAESFAMADLHRRLLRSAVQVGVT